MTISHAPLMAAICTLHNVTPEQLRGDQRRLHLVNARIDFIITAHRAGWGSGRIAYALNRDISTILYHLNKFIGPEDSAHLHTHAQADQAAEADGPGFPQFPRPLPAAACPISISWSMPEGESLCA